MPAQFTTLLAQKLAGLHNIPVTEAVDGEVVINGHVYIAPGGMHLALEEIAGRVMIRLTLEPPENFCRPAVDVLFRTAASIYGPRLLGIVLTGMGSDGAKGAMSISRAGGQIIAQDQATSLIWGMPGAVVRAGLAKKIVALGDVYQELYEHCRMRKAVQ
jgi:two-component system chemotaxis response regulator CheB